MTRLLYPLPPPDKAFDKCQNLTYTRKIIVNVFLKSKPIFFIKKIVCKKYTYELVYYINMTASTSVSFFHVYF